MLNRVDTFRLWYTATFSGFQIFFASGLTVLYMYWVGGSSFKIFSRYTCTQVSMVLGLHYKITGRHKALKHYKLSEPNQMRPYLFSNCQVRCTYTNFDTLSWVLVNCIFTDVFNTFFLTLYTEMYCQWLNWNNTNNTKTYTCNVIFTNHWLRPTYPPPHSWLAKRM